MRHALVNGHDHTEFVHPRDQQYSAISQEWFQAVKEIRAIYGFGWFLRPPPFPELQWAAVHGPVIIVNISNMRSDAIVIVRQANPVLIPLPGATTERVQHLAEAFSQGGSLDNLEAVALRSLKAGSRIWWCPTGGAARLPLHAAGPYKVGEKGMSDMFTSSYIPNLRTLISARKSRAKETFSATLPAILVIGEGETKGEISLPLPTNDGSCIPTNAVNPTILTGADSTKETVLRDLKAHIWVHSSCRLHCNNAEPFASYFALSDGHLSLFDLIRAELPNSELAVLTAYHSVGAPRGDLPNQFLHPAAGLLMAGFKSVVAPMWAVQEGVGPSVSKEFYKEMLGGEDGPKGADHAAIALRNAVASLGQDVPLLQRIGFVHFGI